MVVIDKTPDSRIREECLELAGIDGEDEMIFYDGFDQAIVGVGQVAGSPPIVVYDRQRCLDLLEGLGCDNPREFFEHNVACAYVGTGSPVFVTLLEAGAAP